MVNFRVVGVGDTIINTNFSGAVIPVIVGPDTISDDSGAGLLSAKHKRASKQ